MAVFGEKRAVGLRVCKFPKAVCLALGLNLFVHHPPFIASITGSITGQKCGQGWAIAPKGRGSRGKFGTSEKKCFAQLVECQLTPLGETGDIRIVVRALQFVVLVRVHFLASPLFLSLP